MAAKKVVQKAPEIPKDPELKKAISEQKKETESLFKEGFCVICGRPVAPGQNYVCIIHQRSN